jgi:Chromate resistance exported protein
MDGLRAKSPAQFQFLLDDAHEKDRFEVEIPQHENQRQADRPGPDNRNDCTLTQYPTKCSRWNSAIREKCCTFETLIERFGIRDRAVLQLAELIHDADVEDYDGAALGLSFPSVERPEGKWIARVQAGILIVNQIESTFFQETGVWF